MNIADASEVIDLRHHWRTMLRFRYGILGLGLLGAVIATLLMLRADNIYQSSATLLIESSRPSITSIRDIYSLENQTREYFSTQFELLKGRNLAERVIRELDLLKQPEFARPVSRNSFDWSRLVPGFMRATDASEADAGNEQELMMGWALSEFNERLAIVPVRNTDLVHIVFESTNPELAAQVSNHLANAYIESYLEQRLASTQKASTWMTERLASLKSTLDDSEARLQGFIETENLVDIQGVAALNIQELDELTTQHNEARRIKAEAETAYRQTQQKEMSITELMRIPAVLNHPVIVRVTDTMDSLEQQKAELSKRYGSNHPRMIALTSQMTEAERNLDIQVRQVLATMETDYRNALDNERVTLERLEAAKADYQSVNRMRYEFRELEREVETNRQLYDLFFTRIRETDETDSFTATNALIVDPAVPALDPSKPRRSLVVLLALCGGLLFGAALAFLREMLDNTIHTPADIEDKLDSSTLGIVPLGKGDTKGRNGDKIAYMGFLDDSHSAFAESFRTLRTGIMLSSIDKPYKVIGVTSSVPNEGKTTVSVNLALVMGQMKKTLLIDADMRRPALAKGLGLPPGTPGLSNYIAGTASLKDCIHSFNNGAIAVLPGGQISPNPLELLASSRFRDLLAVLAESYDQIILDTPPTQAVSDALVIGTLADAMVYVVKADATSVSMIKTGLSRLRQASSNVIGIILNQVDADKHAAYYDYGGYYDSYGYSSKSTVPAGASQLP